jgi:uncharacterized protein YbjQ (UPF0145 family)
MCVLLGRLLWGCPGDHTVRSSDTKGADDASAPAGADTPGAPGFDRCAPRAVSERRSMNTPTIGADHIATTKRIAGAQIAKSFGIVVGIAIRSRGVGGNIMAGLDALGNGNGSALDEYRADLEAIRREAIARMALEADELGANAVVEVRFDTAEVGREMVEIVAYGTAVIVEEDP